MAAKDDFKLLLLIRMNREPEKILALTLGGDHSFS